MNTSTGTVSIRAPTRNARHVMHIRDLLYELVIRDIKLRYKRSFLGIVWSLLNPLLQLTVFYFVFGILVPLNIPHYASFVFTGVVVWNWFHSSLLFATGVIVDHRQLIKQPSFPLAILPIATVTSHLVHFLFALPVLLVCVFADVGRITGAIAALPLVILLQFVMTLSIAYLLATFHVRFRDTQYLLGVLLQLLFFLTPIFYNIAAIPDRLRWLLFINPMVPLVEAYRAILIEGQFPGGRPLAAVAMCSVALVAVSYRVFMRASYRFVEEL
ncbi:MAG: ABC transporter permease [Candidatus Binatia bacterium]